MELMQDVKIRWMIRRDMPSVTAIGNAPEDIYLGLLRQRNVIGCVAEIDEKIVGYMMYRVLPQDHTIVLLMMRVADDQRFRGIGKNMMDRLKQKLTGDRYRALVADVEEVDLASQLFMKAVGFEAVAIVELPDNLFGLKSPVCYRFQYPIFGRGGNHGEKRYC
jgi:[ribosomal protein S18]-alanine N-acetyltransferase